MLIYEREESYAGSERDFLMGKHSITYGKIKTSSIKRFFSTQLWDRVLLTRLPEKLGLRQ